MTEEEFAHILSTFPLVSETAKQAALDEFVRMRESGEAATFNPDLAKPAAQVVDPTLGVREMIKAGESATVEFKSTARWNVIAAQPDKKIEQIIAKTVAAFLNTAGGTLVIGVDDGGNVHGLADDYRLCGRKGRDGFELWLMQMLLKEFGKDAASLIGTTFYELAQGDPAKPGVGDVCILTAKPSPKPRFIVEDNREVFYIRTGNATNALKMSEFLAYCATRWPGGIGGAETVPEPAPAQ